MVTGGIRKARCECTIQKALHGVWSKELADLYLEDLKRKMKYISSKVTVNQWPVSHPRTCKYLQTAKKKKKPSAIGLRFAPSPELVAHGLLALVFSTDTKFDTS